jgi:uncharacterized protein YbjT (DUF2867 family)
MIACVVGATGLVGSELLAQLCDSESVSQVHVMTRRALTPGAIASNPKLTQHIVDFNCLQKVEWPRCDHLFCCLGTTIKAAGSQAAFRQVDFDFVVGSALQARQAGARCLLVVSAIGANPHSRTFYSRVKGEMEVAIASLGFDAVLIFRPSFLEGERLESRAGEQVVLSVLKFANRLIPRKYRSVPAQSVARAMIAAAREDHEGVVIFESDTLQSFSR